MRIDSIQIREGSRIVNLTVDSGTSFPSSPNAGELFYRSDNEVLYLHNGTTWVSVSGGGGGGTFTITGDITGTIDGGSDVLTLATVNSNIGTFGSSSATSIVTVNAKGLVTAAASSSIGISASQVTTGTFDNTRIAETNVTQHQAALTILESQINNGSILARVGDSETITGTWTFNNSIVGNISTASTLATARNIALSGDATWSVSFNGSANVTNPLTLATVNSNVGSFGSPTSAVALTVNAKGLVTAASETSIAIAATQVTSDTFADARIAESNVTQHEAALTILESQITDGALLARIGGSETITGSWTFNNAIVANTAPTLGDHLANKTYVDAQVVSASSGLTVVVVSGTTQTAVSGVQYVMTNTGAASTVTFPASPVVGNAIWVSNHTGRTDLTIARNGSNIMSLAEDFIINVDKANVQMRYVDSTRGWILV